ncbi:MAG: hypothetical protein SFU25_07040, partial [Candidatus Caenarcaniphilales bacterium]|nr:hypothetical protein [Candidatus Caenarcaniphilales bacterium]
MKRINVSVKIKKTKNDNDTFLEPIETYWNELRHTQSTIAYINALCEEKESKHLDHWKQELSKLRIKMEDLKKDFSKYYLGCLCLLQ